MDEYHYLSLGHRDIYGRNGMTLEEIKTSLASFDVNAVIEFCSKVGIIVFQTTNRSNDFQESQKHILGALLQTEESRREIGRGIARAVVGKDGVRHWALFTKHSTQYMLKLAVENSMRDGGTVLGPETMPEITRMLLSINDILDDKDFRYQKLVLPTELRRRQIREFMFRRLKFSSEERFPYQLYRNSMILKRLRKSKTIDFKSVFRQATGVSLQYFLDVGTMFSLHWVVKNPDFYKPEDYWFINQKLYFRDVKTSKLMVSKVLNLFTFRLDDYGYLNRAAVEIQRGADVPEYNYLFLMKKPLVEIGNILACPSPEYLISALTHAPYRIVSDFLKETGKLDLFSALPNEWGLAFQGYVHERLHNIFGAQYHEVPEDKIHKRADGLYQGENTVVLFEIKSLHLSYKALVTGSESDLKKPFDLCFGAQQGIVQIVELAKAIRNGSYKIGLNTANRKILPVLILSEYLPADPYNYMFAEIYLRNNKVDYKTGLLPFIYISIEEAEFLEALVVNGSASSHDIELLMVEYSDIMGHPNINNPPSFKNFLFSKGLDFPSNQAIMNEFNRHSKKILSRFFPHKSPAQEHSVHQAM